MANGFNVGRSSFVQRMTAVLVYVDRTGRLGCLWGNWDRSFRAQALVDAGAKCETSKEQAHPEPEEHIHQRKASQDKPCLKRHANVGFGTATDQLSMRGQECQRHGRRKQSDIAKMSFVQVPPQEHLGG